MKTNQEPDAAALRRLAEERLKARASTLQSAIRNPQSEQRLVHELQVHQIELEMQNEELQRSRAELTTALDGYAELYDFAPAGYLTLQPDGSIRQTNLAAASLLGSERARLLGRHLEPFVAAEDRSALAALLTRAWASQSPEVGEVTRVSQGQSPLPLQLSACASADGQECRVVMTDLSERKRAEALGASDLFTRSILNSLTAHIAVLDEQGVIVAVNEAWRRFARENGAADSDACLGANYLEVCEASLRRGPDESAAAALRGLRAVRSGAQNEFWLEYPCHSPNEQRWFRLQATRLATGGGSMVVAHENITERKQTEQQLGASREQLRALAARLQVVREEERAHVAREIHDVLAQELTRLKLDVVWLKRRLARPLDAGQQEVLLEKLEETTVVADAAIQSVQKIATELRPAVLDSLGLCAAVEWQAHDFQARSGIVCVATVPEEVVPLGQDHATAMFRILQESLTNVLRHAHASWVEVRLRLEADQVVLRIQDNGCGIRPETLNHPRSIGLVGMRERALLAAGQFEIRSQPESGTTVEIRLPLGKNENQPEGKP